LPVEQAAMFFVNPASAYVMTRRLLNVPASEWLLQTAAGSSLGRMVIRLGKKFGFRTLNVVRRAEQAEELHSLGADAVVAFDSAKDDPEKFRADVLNATKSEGVHYAIDPVGGQTGSAVVSCLGNGGRMLVYGTLSDEPLRFSPRTLMTVGASIEGFWLARWILTQGLVAKLRLVKKIANLIREGVLSSEVGQSYHLDQIADAVREAEKVGRDGKVLLRMG
jgi:NADPH:quinone reductase-like Zn-dependent oxidoreductase